MKLKLDKIIYLLRHGETELNRTGKRHQAPTTPLSEIGRKQAEKIAKRVSKLNFEAFITSSFVRAKQTAEIISQHLGVKFEESDLFVERKRPKIVANGLVDDPEVRRVFDLWSESLYTPGMKVQDGENFDEIVRRADQALAYLLSREEKEILVVTHGFFMRVLVARAVFGESLDGEIFRKFWHATKLDNTGLTVLKHYQQYFKDKNHWLLWILNDHAHLAE